MDHSTRTDAVIDPRYIINLLIELQVSIRKLSLYSLSHSQVTPVLENLEKRFNALFEFVDEISLGVTRTEFVFQGSPLSSGNLVIRELAKKMNQLGLASVRFAKTLAREEILKFLQFMVEGGRLSSEIREQASLELQQENAGIRVQLIRFGGALRNSEREVVSGDRPADGPAGKGLWRNLVTALTENAPEGNSALSGDRPGGTANPEELAQLINRLCKSHREESKSYERAIVKYLSHQQGNPDIASEERIRFNRELSTLLTMLEPEVREQIFRIALEDSNEEKGPLTELLPYFSEPVMVELFNQIHQSKQSISSPMLSLLNKFSELSAQNDKLAELLSAKPEGEQNVFRELLTNRANRQFYPASYRTFLDQELVNKIEGKSIVTDHEAGIDPQAVNTHLALILLELMEAPVESEASYSALITQITRILGEGQSDPSGTLLQSALFIILNKLKESSGEKRNFLEIEIKKFVNARFLGSLLQSLRVSGDERIGELFNAMREFAGGDLIPTLMDQLETEENLSVRKSLLSQLLQCGKIVVPHAIRRISSPKWFVVRNMLVLLKDLRAEEALPEILRVFLEANSSKVKLAALQALEAIGKGTEFFLKGTLAALDEQDPRIVSHAVTMILESQEPRTMEILKKTVRRLFERRNGASILQVIRRSDGAGLIPDLEALRWHLRIRFWKGSRFRTLLKSVNDTIRHLSARRKN